MKFIYQLILFCVAVVALASCTKTVKVKVPEMKEGLTLFCTTETGSQMWVIVGKSYSILRYNNKQDLFVTNATVKMYADGQFIETLKYDADMGAYLSAVAAEAGKLYKLTVEAQGYTTIEAEAKAPEKIPVTYTEVKDTAIPSSFGGFTMATSVTMQFNDPPGQANYYLLSFYGAEQVAYGDLYTPSYECLTIKDPSIDQQMDIFGESCLNGEILFNDDLFNGRTKLLMSFVNSYPATPIPVGSDSVYALYKLMHVSEAHYRYNRSFRKAQEADGNPFAEPVNVYTNVKNGYGIFAITNPEYIQVKH